MAEFDIKVKTNRAWKFDKRELNRPLCATLVGTTLFSPFITLNQGVAKLEWKMSGGLLKKIKAAIKKHKQIEYIRLQIEDEKNKNNESNENENNEINKKINYDDYGDDDDYVNAIKVITIGIHNSDTFIKRGKNGKDLELPILLGNIRVSSLYNEFQSKTFKSSLMRKYATANINSFVKGLAIRSLAFLLAQAVKLWNSDLDKEWICLEASGQSYQKKEMSGLIKYYSKFGFQPISITQDLHDTGSWVYMHAPILTVLEKLSIL